MATAVQKYISQYPDAGLGQIDDYDWHGIDLAGAPSGWSGLTVPGRDGFVRHFLVSDGQIDGDDTQRDPNTHIMTLEDFQKQFDIPAD
jgi:hypothetical protein